MKVGVLFSCIVCCSEYMVLVVVSGLFDVKCRFLCRWKL